MATQNLEFLGKTCPKCEGHGILPIGQADEDYLSCPTCLGEGVVTKEVTKVDHVEQACDNPKCDKGKVKKAVTNSDGTVVEVDVDCPVCDGLTRIVKDVARTYDEVATCPTCQGAGLIQMEDLRKKGKQVLCDQCKGLGVLPNKGKLALIGLGIGFVVLMPMVAFVAIILGFMGFGLVRTLKKDPSDKPAKIRREKRSKE